MDFLEQLDPDGLHFVTAFDPNIQSGPIKAEAGTAAEISFFAADCQAQGLNCYYSVNEPGDIARRDAGRKKKLNKTDIVKIRGVWADIDCPGINSEVEIQIIIDRLAPLLTDFPPTFTIDSGGGVQLLWLLADFLPATPGNIRLAENTGLAIAEALGGDHVHNIDRIMRHGVSTNFPDAKKRAKGRVKRDTRLLETLPRRYDLSELSDHWPLDPDRITNHDSGTTEDFADVRAKIDPGKVWHGGPIPDALQAKLDNLRFGNDDFKRLYDDGDPGVTARGKPKDASGSGLVYNLAAQLVKEGFAPEEFAQIATRWPKLDRKNASERSIVRAYANARAKARKAAPGGISEDAVALAFASKYAGQLLYDHSRGTWFRWNGQYWQPDERKLAFEYVRQQAREAATGAKIPQALRRAGFAHGVEAFCRCDPAFAVIDKDWNADPDLLGTPEGVVDLRTGQMLTADPAMRINKVTLVAPDRENGCPHWLAFLDEAMRGNMALIRFLQQWAGYSLTGHIHEEKLVFLHGPGGNGKGTFISTLIKIAGDYGVTASMHTFTSEGSHHHLTHIAMLAGARMATAQETEEGSKWDEGRIKALTGGDRISANYMRQDPFTFTPQFSLTLSGNYAPKLTNVDAAMIRRLCMVPFTVQPRAVDSRLKVKLMAEAGAILAWMIDGAVDWYKHGLVVPRAVREATKEYFDKQSIFENWVRDMCRIGRGHEDTTRNLYAAYLEEMDGDRAAMSRVDFGHKLGELGTRMGADKGEPPLFTPGKVKGQRGWQGIEGPPNDMR